MGRELAMTRLLTLIGAEGSGKTRLASEVALGLVGAYSEGIWSPGRGHRNVSSREQVAARLQE